jgi:hypothetical protein
MLAWAFVDYLLVRDRYDCAGDHAGGGRHPIFFTCTPKRSIWDFFWKNLRRKLCKKMETPHECRQNKAGAVQ